MKKGLIFAVCLFFSIINLYAQPIEYLENSNLSNKEFFELYYREKWKSLSEIEQFAIACSSNIFQRNKQYHLDFCNRTVFNDSTLKGEEVLNDSWKIYNYEQLMENYNELSAGEQNSMYKELALALEKNPDLSVIEIGEKEDYNISAVSRMYLVQDKKEILGKHDLEAWIDARRISIIRWGIGAGYISEQKGYELITPVVESIKNNYVDFEDFIAHWVTGYCFNVVYDSECPECSTKLFKAIENARAYIPFEELPFTGENADKNHTMKLSESVYTPSSLAEKMIPVQKFYKRYRCEKPSKELYQEVLKQEQEYPEISNLLILPRFTLMCVYSSSRERIDYIESKMEYLSYFSEGSELYNTVMKYYAADLINLYQPEKVLSLYKRLPQSLQTDNDVYYSYGYANFLMAFSCTTITEKDIYTARAVDVFTRLKSHGYEFNSFIENWLKMQ